MSYPELSTNEVLAECEEYFADRWRANSTEFELLERVRDSMAERDPQAKHVQATLRALESYFDQRADADYDYNAERYVSNRAMSLLTDLRALRGER